MDDMHLAASDCDDSPESPVASSSIAPGPAFAGRGACEACRARKIRCDRESPCLPCRRAEIECVHPAVKRKEKRTRILLTPQYERKIDLIDHRLEDLTRLLQQFKTQVPTTTADKDAQREPSRSFAALSTVASSPGQSVASEPARATVVEGESSLSAHSVFVNDFLRTFVDPGHPETPDPEILRTLDDLSHIVSASKQQPRARELVLPHARLERQPPPRKYDLPPIQKAVSLIRAAKAQHLAGTGWVYEYITMQSFGDLCLGVYFSEDLSLYDFISVNAGLHSLFWDYALTAELSQDEKQQYITYAHLCRDNLETGLAGIPLHLPATANVIAALLFGAFYAIEFSTSSLCWSLSSKASELCQTLGYHKTMPQGVSKPGSISYEQFLLWTTYYVDKSLSLRLGRASTIPDWDITISPPSFSDQSPVLAFFVLWIKTARCQGNIYEMLYSPASGSQPDQVRQSRVDSLVSNLQEIERETAKTKDKWLKTAKENSGGDLMDFYAISDDILRLSLLTHTYRAAPRIAQSPHTFNLNCITAARASLDRHHDCMAVIHRTNNIYFSTYINWTLLFAPFVPFIVIFCHVMETQNQTDLARLEAFVGSIHAATTVSESAARMHRLFQVLYNIATRYVELRVQQDGRESMAPVMDAQLAAMGFPHAGLWELNRSEQVQTTGLVTEHSPDAYLNMHQMGLGQSEYTPSNHQPVNPVLWMGNGPQLEYWLYDNQASMELLQDANLDTTS